MRAAERLGGFGTLTARGRSPGLTNKGLRLGRNHARRRVVRPKHRLEVLTVFTTQYMEMNLLLLISILQILTYQSFLIFVIVGSN